jgi:SET domain
MTRKSHAKQRREDTMTATMRFAALLVVLKLLAMRRSLAFLSIPTASRNIRFEPFDKSVNVRLNGSKGFGKSAKSNKCETSRMLDRMAKPAIYTPDTSKKVKSLLEWLEEEEIEGLEGVEIGLSPLPDGNVLRGVFATRDFEVGDYILAVPFVSTLLVHEGFEENETNSVANKENRMSTSQPENGLLLWKRFLRTNDAVCKQQFEKYKPYLDCIPMTMDDPNFDVTPDFWTDDEIQQLKVPTLVQDILLRKASMQHLVDHHNSQHPDRLISLPEIQMACWIIQTRGFTTFKKAIDLDGKEGLLTRVVLIPFLDFVNHGAHTETATNVLLASNVALDVVETKAYDESFYALVATGHIRKGQEIRICYGTGQESSVEIYLKYGFLPPDNHKNDKIKLPTMVQGTNLKPHDNEGSQEGARGTRKPQELLDFLMQF